VPLAIENHKDWTADEMAALMKEKASRWLGVCLDTGNNIALLDDPMATVEALAPYAISTHIKDMGSRRIRTASCSRRCRWAKACWICAASWIPFAAPGRRRA
jgi:sugar phosphate isomerase/epimerase